VQYLVGSAHTLLLRFGDASQDYSWPPSLASLTAVKIREKLKLAMTCLANHPEKSVIRLQPNQNVALPGLNEEDRAELELEAPANDRQST